MPKRTDRYPRWMHPTAHHEIIYYYRRRAPVPKSADKRILEAVKPHYEERPLRVEAAFSEDWSAEYRQFCDDYRAVVSHLQQMGILRCDIEIVEEVAKQVDPDLGLAVPSRAEARIRVDPLNIPITTVN